MKTLDKLLASVLAVTLVFSVLSVANPYYFVVGPSAYAENDDDVEEESNYGHGGNAAHDSDSEEHDDCNPEDDVEEEAHEEEANDDDTEDETSDEQESDNDSNSDESDEEDSSEEDVSDEEQADEQEEDDVDEHEEESAEEENEVEDEAEDNDDDSQDTNDAEAAEEETEDQCNNQGRSDEEDEQEEQAHEDDEHQVTEEEIKEKQNERRHHIVESITGMEIHQRHMNAEPMSVGEYAPGLQYSLTAAGVAEHGGVHTVEVDMDIAVWKSTSAIVLMDVLGGTVTVEGHAYSVAVGYALYSTQSDMMRVSALVVDEDTGNVFKLKLRGNAIGDDAQLPMNTGEALDMSFEGNSGPSKNEFAGAELDLEGSITST